MFMIDMVKMAKSILHIPEKEPEDICGFCGRPGADKIPHPVRWPGEDHPGSDYVHVACENNEWRRAHSMLTDKQRERFLRNL
jgi:hypothetical protein